MTSENMEIGFYLIGNPGRCQCSKLFKEISSLANIQSIPAVIVDESIHDTFYSDIEFRVRVGRAALQGEIGCALAHQSAYSRIIENQHNWSLIIEDDAHLEEASKLEDLLFKIRTWESSRPVIVSFYTDDLVVRNRFSSNFNNKRKIPIPPPNTVAYALNKRAAEVLKEKNEIIGNLADWPANAKEIDFYLFSNSNVVHGCSESVSTIINSTGYRPTPNLSVKVQIWSGIWFFRYKRYWGRFSNFFYGALNPRIRYKIEQIIQKLSR